MTLVTFLARKKSLLCMCDRSIHTLEGGEHNRSTPEHMKMGGGVGGVGEEKKMERPRNETAKHQEKHAMQ